MVMEKGNRTSASAMSLGLVAAGFLVMGRDDLVGFRCQKHGAEASGAFVLGAVS